MDGYIEDQALKGLTAWLPVLTLTYSTIIMGYDSLDSGYMSSPLSIVIILRLLTNVLRHTAGGGTILELSGGYNVNMMGEYVKKSLKILDDVL